MAKASEQFRQSDVTLWGVIALLSAGLAVFGSNISLLVPQSIIGGLHQPRVAGSSIETLRGQVASLQETATQLKRENETLVSRFAIQEQAGNDTIRRVGALEVSMPRLLEAVPESALIDRSLTASIGENQTLTFDADGGSVAVRQVPLPGASNPPAAVDQKLPPLIDNQVAMAAPNPIGYGIAIGAAVPEAQTQSLWTDLTIKLGPLLFGLSPLVADESNGTGKHIVVGPISELSEARALCERFERVAISCMPAPYAGEALSLPQ